MSAEFPPLVYCTPCRLRFEVRAPNHGRGEFLRCPECGRRFWRTETYSGGPDRIGVLPQDVRPL